MRVSFEDAQRAYDRAEPEDDRDTLEDVSCSWCGKNLGPARSERRVAPVCTECQEEQAE